MYARILVPLDGSALAERALPHAGGIGRATGAEVILLQVVQAPLGDAPEAGQTEEDRAIREAAVEALSYLGTIKSAPRSWKGLQWKESSASPTGRMST
jgi:nucleotide-binding universal stress UspA family protein